jgi:hypothetical protein
MQCPKCESDDVLLCSVAHDQGKTTHQIKGTSNGAVGGQRTTGDHSSTGTSITEFARRAAPPQPAFDRAILNVIAAVAAFIILPSALKDLTHSHANWAYYPLLACIAFTIYRLTVAAKDKPLDRARREEWERSWICKRCGTIFDPENQVPGVAPAE